MPIYEYQCTACGARSEELQRMSDPPLVECSICGGRLRRLISAPAVQFKGSGWYVTDYAGKKSDAGARDAGANGSESRPAEGGSSDGGPSDGGPSDGGSAQKGTAKDAQTAGGSGGSKAAPSGAGSGSNAPGA